MLYNNFHSWITRWRFLQLSILEMSHPLSHLINCTNVKKIILVLQGQTHILFVSSSFLKLSLTCFPRYFVNREKIPSANNAYLQGVIFSVHQTKQTIENMNSWPYFETNNGAK